MSENRQLEISFKELGEDDLLLRSFSGSEQLSQPFEYQLDLLSKKADIAFEDVVGKEVSIALDLPDDEQRFFHGYVSRFAQTGGTSSYSQYRAVVVPRLWFLTRKANCKIFQKKDYSTIADVIFAVLDENEIEFEKHLDLSLYREWEFCVQYRETDFNFISRLMEQEGIYYYFKHEDGKHILILCDSPSKHDPFPNYDTIPYRLGQTGTPGEQVSEWIIEKEVQTADYVLGDFDFKNPKPLTKESSNEGDFAEPKTEVYDYPGEYTDENTDSYKDHGKHGEHYAEVRIQDLRVQGESYQGMGDARGIATGYKFKLEGDPRCDETVEYLVTQSNYDIDCGEFESSDEIGAALAFQCAFSAITSETQYRPALVTPKPLVQGPQTAIVAGGDAIDVDKYGRVKVQFHWDREGNSDQDSSCWVRVSQNWAGAQWGGMFVPHTGQEVIVEFLEGDPDKPIITGRVYNEDNMPPQELPANKTKSIIRDHGDNQMVMEGAGPQFIHLQQDCGNEVLMDAETPSITVKQDCGNEMHLEASEPSITIKQACGNEAKFTATGPEIHMTQACGNQIIMKDGMGITIQDQYGNKVVLDAAAGTLTAASPSHDSKIVLGQSIHQTTQSKKTDFINADAKATIMGMTAELYVGAKSDTKVGLFHDTLVGGKLTLNAAADISVTTGIKIEKGNVKKVCEFPMITTEAKASYMLKSPVIILDGEALIGPDAGSCINIKGGEITIKASKIKLDGEVYCSKGVQIKGEMVDKKGALKAT